LSIPFFLVECPRWTAALPSSQGGFYGSRVDERHGSSMSLLIRALSRDGLHSTALRQVHSWRTFSRFSELCHCPHHTLLGHVQSPERPLEPHNSPPTCSPRQPLIFLYIDLPFPDISQKWNHTVVGLCDVLTLQLVRCHMSLQTFVDSIPEPPSPACHPGSPLLRILPKDIPFVCPHVWVTHIWSPVLRLS
jgi:hypothetical protein